jgi:hypothetical protein
MTRPDVFFTDSSRFSGYFGASLPAEIPERNAQA